MVSNVPKQDLIIKLLTVLFPTSKIYLFGSRARGTHTERSDIDIAIDIGRKLEIDEWAIADGVLAGLNIPQKIDVIDVWRASESMKQQILKDGIVWKA
ncbi:MAG TPA: nucleotidyltransferase domain-containing protein [Candidatus Babeliales bacterium]|nr:nucleotidyltransferase domain-containing protein [Candidatus Babeliales bacterium]